MSKNLYFHFYLFFSIDFFEGVSRGSPYRWSMDRSVRWSEDPVRWTGPRTGVSVFGSPLLPRVWPISSKVALLITYETTSEKSASK